MFDFVCIGNALIDAFLTIHEANSFCRVDKDTHELCLKSGEKIPLENAQFELGGNACNVSVGLKRLGLHTALIAEFGKDAFAQKIKHQLAEEGVSLIHSVTTDSSSSFSVGINFKEDRSLFVWHVDRKHDFNFRNMRTKWVYLSSIGESWRHVYRSIPSFIKESDSLLAFNPGTRQVIEGKEVLEPILAVTDILFVNKEEGERIAFGKEQVTTGDIREQIEKTAQILMIMGSKLVVITDGKRGSYALGAHGKFYHQGTIDADVVEKTGAGDSFSTGFLAAMHYGYDVQTAMRWGAINAASVISKVGAQPGLLTKREIERRVKGEA